MSNFGYRANDQPSALAKMFHARKPFLLLIIAAIVLILATFGNKGLLRRIMLGHEVTDKEQRIAQLKVDIKSLTSQRNLLSSDEATIERVARETHGMIKPGEVVYRVKPAEPASVR